jgi:hypothetical protein
MAKSITTTSKLLWTPSCIDLEVEIKAQLIGKVTMASFRIETDAFCMEIWKPLPHDLSAAFNATPSEFTLKPLLLTVASSTMELQGQVQNYSQPSASGSYRITIHRRTRGRLSGTLPSQAGEVTLTGSIRYRQQENVPVIALWIWMDA